MKRLFTFLFCILVCFSVRAQLSTNEKPISFIRSSEMDSNRQIDKRIMPALDMEAIIKEDLEDELYDYPPRFGYSHIVDYNLQNSGTWHELSNGDKLWQLTISCPKAVSINLLYDKFWIPKGGKLFIFTPDKQQYIGAFTFQNNKGDKSNIQGFATDLLYSDEITLEYFQPKDVSSDAIISISSVVHGYRNIGYGGACDSQVNVNCSEGNNWQNEKRAVALILVNGNRYCSGSLIRSTSNNFQPLFLTADHCLGGWVNEYYAGISGYKYDAINSPTLNHWTFWWNYETPGCDNPTNEPGHLTTHGATVLANNPYSDFALLELSEDPLSLSNYIPYYLGWDRSGNSGTGGVGIHHPKGDVKKISTYSMTPITTTFNISPSVYWGVNWVTTDHGHSITEEGSSGSPLINSNHRVIGQLRGATASCSNTSGMSKYGKLDVSWNGNGNIDVRRRLDHWLDPTGTNAQSINGTHPLSISGSTLVCSTATYSIQNYPSGATVVWSTSNSNLSIISGQGTGNATFQKNSNGACVIMAQVSVGTISLNITKNVWAGTPTAPSISGWPNTNLFLANSQYMLYANVDSQAQVTEYQWDVVRGATITSGGNTDSPIFTMNSSGSVRIGVRARNACGWGPYTYMNGGITNDNGQTPINSPGNNIVNIPLPEEGEYEIMLWNTNRLIRTVKTSQSSYDVDLNGLPSDLYIIKVMKDGQSIYQLKVKK